MTFIKRKGYKTDTGVTTLFATHEEALGQRLKLRDRSNPGFKVAAATPPRAAAIFVRFGS
jgi:hypothetical protein